MRVMSEMSELAALRSPLFLCIGTFDGLHRGHRAVLDELIAAARAEGGTAVVVTFEPHPQEVVRPDTAPLLLSTLEEKQRAIEEAGVDALLVLRFDAAMAKRSGEEFLRGLFASVPGVRGLVLGHDSRLGRGRATSVEDVCVLAEREGWSLRIVPPVLVDGEPISSTRIRKLLLAGDMRAAAELIGRPYEFEGVVVTGDGRGRELGFPTANLGSPGRRKLIPPDGIYATRVVHRGNSHAGAMSIGIRPTFGAGPRVIEIHLLGVALSLVGETLRVSVIERLRDEKRFDSIDQLQDAMREDCRRTLALADPRGARAHPGESLAAGGEGVVGWPAMPGNRTKGGGGPCP